MFNTLTKNNTVWQHDTVIDVAYHNIYIVAWYTKTLGYKWHE